MKPCLVENILKEQSVKKTPPWLTIWWFRVVAHLTILNHVQYNKVDPICSYQTGFQLTLKYIGLKYSSILQSKYTPDNPQQCASRIDYSTTLQLSTSIEVLKLIHHLFLVAWSLLKQTFPIYPFFTNFSDSIPETVTSIKIWTNTRLLKYYQYYVHGTKSVFTLT